jgi:hypothetical protein
MKFLDQGLVHRRSNSSRVGCPDLEFLKRLAQHQIPIREVDPWIDHLGSCGESTQTIGQEATWPAFDVVWRRGIRCFRRSGTSLVASERAAGDLKNSCRHLYKTPVRSYERGRPWTGGNERPDG